MERGFAIFAQEKKINLDCIYLNNFISAFIFALISIRFFLKLINKIKLVPFAIYRIVLAAIIYFFFL
ncbi:Bacitracin resistance protein BacA [Thermoactinomyces sp. DSM 45891]|nr:Bacitracin resistance protein BacA [Thermoactinomyces sp. DSM 45891]